MPRHGVWLLVQELVSRAKNLTMFSFDMKDYDPPPGGLECGLHPRQPIDVLLKVSISYLVALFAYIHHVILLSPGPTVYAIDVIYVLSSLFFPFLPVVFLSINLLKTLKNSAWHSSRATPHRYVIAGLFGARILDTSDFVKPKTYHLLDVPPSDIEPRVRRWSGPYFLARTLILAATTLASWLGIAVYHKRVQITYHGATYVAALGLDHRAGWLAISTFLVSAMTLPLHLVNTRWETTSKTALPASQGSLDLALAIFLAALSQDILGVVTNHPSGLKPMLRAFIAINSRPDIGCLLTIIFIMLAYRYHALVTLRGAMMATAGLILLWVTLVATSQLLWDLDELVDVNQGWYQPWNYRWAVEDRPWHFFPRIFK